LAALGPEKENGLVGRADLTFQADVRGEVEAEHRRLHEPAAGITELSRTCSAEEQEDEENGTSAHEKLATARASTLCARRPDRRRTKNSVTMKSASAQAK